MGMSSKYEQAKGMVLRATLELMAAGERVTRDAIRRRTGLRWATIDRAREYLWDRGLIPDMRSHRVRVWASVAIEEANEKKDELIKQAEEEEKTKLLRLRTSSRRVQCAVPTTEELRREHLARERRLFQRKAM